MAENDMRKSRRINFREAVQHRFPEKSTLIGSLGYDLSEGGVRFRTEDFLPVHSEVVINLQLKADREANLAARVVWIQRTPHGEDYQVGCEFLENRENVFPKMILKSFVEAAA